MRWTLKPKPDSKKLKALQKALQVDEYWLLYCYNAVLKHMKKLKLFLDQV